MFILNEKEWIEKKMKDDKLYRESGLIMTLLTRYYIEKGLNKEEIVKEVVSYFRERTKYNFKEDLTFLYASITADKELKNITPLMQIPYIAVSSSELSIIRTLNNKSNERYLFSLLCIAKYKNMVNPKNDNWTCKDIGSVFKKVANLNFVQEQQYSLIRDIIDRGLIRMGSGDNLNIQVLFMDGKDEYIKVDSFTDLGKFYGDLEKGKLVRCKECDKLVKRKSPKATGLKYCEECSKKVKNEQNIKSYHKNKTV